MNDFLLRLKKYIVKYREWLIVVLLLGLIVYFLLMYQGLTRRDVEKEILGGKSAPVAEDEALEYERIVNRIMTVPETYIDLVKHNPFIDIESILQQQRELQDIYEEGRRLFNVGSFAEAEQRFQDVFKRDPYEARIEYKPYKPSTFIERCRQESQVQQLRALYTQGLQKFRQAQEMDKPGGVSDEELLRVYRDCQRLLKTVAEKGEAYVPEAVADAREKLSTVVDERVRQLEQSTFYALSKRLYDEAVDFWNRREEKLTNLADAKGNLDRVREMLDEYSEDLPDNVVRIGDQVGTLLDQLEGEVDRRYPILLNEAETLEAEGQGDLAKLKRALEIYQVLYRLRAEQAIDDRVENLNRVIQDIERKETTANAQRWLAEAKQKLDAAKAALGNQEWEQLVEVKREGLSLLDRFQDLPDLPDLQPIRAEADVVRQTLDRIKPLPIVGDVELERATAQRAVVLLPITNTRRFLQLGREDPVSGLTFSRIGRTEGGRIVSIYVEKEGFRETEVALKE